MSTGRTSAEPSTGYQNIRRLEEHSFFSRASSLQLLHFSQEKILLVIHQALMFSVSHTQDYL